MAFMQIAIGAIGIGVVIMIAYLVIAQVRDTMPSAEEINDTNFTNSLESSQATVIAGLGLLGVGVIIVAAFGLINIFKWGRKWYICNQIKKLLEFFIEA